MSSVSASLSILPLMAENISKQLPSVIIFNNGPNSIPQAKYYLDNLKFVKGWNQAMRHIIKDFNPEYVWMLNDDIEDVAPWMFDRLIMAMSMNQRAAAITPAFNSPHEAFHHKSGYDYGIRKVAWIDWCMPLVRVSAWKDIGDFDEIFVGYGADIDWCKRARDKNWEFFVHEGCSAKHIGSVSTNAIGAEDMRDVVDMSKKLKEKWGCEWWELTVA